MPVFDDGDVVVVSARGGGSVGGGGNDDDNGGRGYLPRAFDFDVVTPPPPLFLCPHPSSTTTVDKETPEDQGAVPRRAQRPIPSRRSGGGGSSGSRDAVWEERWKRKDEEWARMLEDLKRDVLERVDKRLERWEGEMVARIEDGDAEVIRSLQESLAVFTESTRYRLNQQLAPSMDNLRDRFVGLEEDVRAEVDQSRKELAVMHKKFDPTTLLLEKMREEMETLKGDCEMMRLQVVEVRQYFSGGDSAKKHDSFPPSPPPSPQSPPQSRPQPQHRHPLFGGVEEHFEDLVELSPNGDVVFTIAAIAKLVDDGGSWSSIAVHCSQGYALGIEVKSTKEYVRFYPFIAKGKKDDQLDWPFRHSISLWLVGEREGGESPVHCAKLDPVPSHLAFARPSVRKARNSTYEDVFLSIARAELKQSPNWDKWRKKGLTVALRVTDETPRRGGGCGGGCGGGGDRAIQCDQCATDEDTCECGVCHHRK